MTTAFTRTRTLLATVAATTVCLGTVGAAPQHGHGGGGGSQLAATADVLYTVSKNDQSSIMLLDSASGETGVLVSGAGSGLPGFPVWSPDGNRVAYLDSAGAIHVIHTDGTGDTVILADAVPAGYGSYLDWSRSPTPAGIEMLIWSSPAGIHVVGIDGSGYALLTTGLGWSRAVWSPAGDRFVVSFARPEGGGQLIAFTVAAAGNSLAIVDSLSLTHGPDNPFGDPSQGKLNPHGFDWSNSGDSIVLLAVEIPSFEADLWLLSPDDPTVFTRLTYTPAEWEFSPSFDATDTRIFCVYEDPRQTLVALDVGDPVPDKLLSNRWMSYYVRARRN